MLGLKNSQSRSINRRGSSAVEFTLVFPLVLMFFFALTVFTQAFWLKDTAQHAAYEGARKGMLLQATSDDVRATAEEFLRKIRVNGAKVYVSPENITTGTELVSVKVQIPFSENAWVAAPFLPKTWNASSVIQLRRFKKYDN